MKPTPYLFLVLLVAICLNTSLTAQVATGGGYTLEQAVVGNGGTTTGDAQYTIEATAGQPAAGGNLVGTSNFGVRDGFWSRFAIGTTAADVLVSGRVLTANGNGLRGIRVTLSGGQLTAPRQAITGSFGYFTFTDIEAGHTYIVTVHAKLYNFAQPSRAITAIDSVTDIEFVAGGANR